MAVINFSANTNEGGGWVPFPEGTYNLRILEATVTTSKNGNMQLQLSCEVADGSRAGDRTKVWYSLLPQSGWKLRRLLDTLQIAYDATEYDSGMMDLQFDTDDLLNRVVSYDVTQETYNGKVTNRFNNESKSPLDSYVNQAEVEAPAPAPAVSAPVAAAPAPQQRGAVARRPRPSHSGT